MSVFGLMIKQRLEELRLEQKDPMGGSAIRISHGSSNHNER
jgi:hypothetical protein